MAVYIDIKGTTELSFLIGINKFLIDANAPTALRTFTVGDEDIDFTSPNTNDILKFNGTKWLPAAGGGGGAGNLYRGASVGGTIIVQTSAGLPIYFPAAATIQKVSAYVRTAPTGANIIIDVNKNGTTIFTTQGNRPTIPDGSNDDLSAIPDVTAIAAGDVLEIDVDQIGSGTAGADLVVIIQIQE